MAKNVHQAAKWYAESAKRGNADAQVKLGLMYGKAKGARKNIYTTKELFLRSVVHDNKQAKNYFKFWHAVVTRMNV